MLNVQNIQIPDDFECPMEGHFYVTKGGGYTNVKAEAEATWFDASVEEMVWYRRLVGARLQRMLAVISAATLAEDFGIDYRTVVRLARWDGNSLYRPAPWLLVRAVFEELFERKIG